MYRFVLTLALIALFGVLGESRHIKITESPDSDIDLLKIEPRINIEDKTEVNQSYQPVGFVPNNVLFFKRYPPCQEGFKRDILGVCREVW